MITLNPVIVNLDITLDPPLFDVKFEFAIQPVAVQFDFFPQKPPGLDGKSVELQTTATHIQWRVIGGEWANLIALSVITGATGKQVELQTAGGYIQWRLVGDADWINLIALSALQGNDGDDGRGISGTSYNAATGVLTITYTDNTTYSTGDLRGATGKSQYQSYLDTTTDNPVLSEAVWSANRKMIEYLNKDIAFAIINSNFYTVAHYGFYTSVATSTTLDLFLLGGEGFFYRASKNRKINKIAITVGYLSSNSTFNARISVVKHDRAYAAAPGSQITNQVAIIAKDVEFKSQSTFDLTADLNNANLEAGKYLSLGIKRLDAVNHSFAVNIYMKFEDL